MVKYHKIFLKDILEEIFFYSETWDSTSLITVNNLPQPYEAAEKYKSQFFKYSLVGASYTIVVMEFSCA